jgi:hypothetical protein
MLTHQQVKTLISHLELCILGVDFVVLVEYDKKYTVHGAGNAKHGRTYIQLQYKAPCTKTGLIQDWKSDKYYLSSHMTEDEVVKKVYVLFKQAVEHELMEGFKFDKKIVFNPHTSFRDLLTVHNKEITRL